MKEAFAISSTTLNTCIHGELSMYLLYVLYINVHTCTSVNVLEVLPNLDLVYLHKEHRQNIVVVEKC